jgi:hypothetical protein
MSQLRIEPDLKPFDRRWLEKRGNFYALITPDQAAELIATCNTSNRRIKRLKIVDYGRDMAAGRWDPDASDIKFSRDGVLLDGQNRLLACVEADVPFPTLVRTGLNPEAQTHMDTGAVRTMADVYRLHGVSQDPNNVAAAASLRARYDDMLANATPIRVIPRKPLTRAEALDVPGGPSAASTKMVTLARSVYDAAPGCSARSGWPGCRSAPRSTRPRRGASPGTSSRTIPSRASWR